MPSQGKIYMRMKSIQAHNQYISASTRTLSIFYFIFSTFFLILIIFTNNLERQEQSFINFLRRYYTSLEVHDLSEKAGRWGIY